MQCRLHQLAAALPLLFVTNASAAVRYVDLNCTNPTPPYTNWATAAVAIQDAVDTANPADTILVTNGVYQTGGRVVYGTLTNRVVVDKAVTVQSVNGSATTVIQGYQTPGTTNGDSSVRCVYLGTNASLIGFTITKGATLQAYYGEASSKATQWCSGGGVWCEDASAVVSDCVLSGNSADFSFYGMGGGAFRGTLNRCVLASNLACNGGGASGSTLNDCTITGNSVFANGGSVVDVYAGGAHNCRLTNCTLLGNWAAGNGGGAAFGTLYDCTVHNNVAAGGGGTYNSTVIASTIAGNSAGGSGGGAYYGTLNNCTLTGNSAAQGGGVNSGALTNCILSRNLALDSGGSASSSTLINCGIFNNAAITNGGGAYGGALNNCTVLGNTARNGGGAASASLSNCIVYYNQALNGTNCWASTLDYCCTVSLPTNGVANISDDPQLADPVHLSAASPCLGAGNPTSASGVDIDGEAWANPPAIGCDEFSATSASGLLSVSIQSDYANAKSGSGLSFTAGISGHASASSWDFGDGSVVSNRPCATHSWTTPGDYQVVLSAYNQSYPGGVSATSTVHVLEQPMQYVAQAGVNPIAPFLSWATAATNLQDALDAAFAGGGTIVVSNGVYRTGGKAVTGVLTNRVAITQAMTVQSVNGPAVTFIEGSQVPGTINGDDAVRCAYLADGAALVGFTLTNGATRRNNSSYVEMSGGGAWCQSTNAVLSNCVVVANSCYWFGAGVYFGTLLDCEVNTNTNLNTCLAGGGGSVFSQLVNCRLSGNRTSAGDGGGALSCYLTNCLLTGNYDVGASKCTLDNCLVTANNGTGVSGGVANNCTISSNALPTGSLSYGGGAAGATLNNCLLYANQAFNGGGVYNCSLSLCTVSNNWAAHFGGGIYSDAHVAATISDCTLSGNAAGDSGGGFYCLSVSSALALTRCTFSGNAATNNGGGMAFAGSSSGKIAGCALSNNRAGANGGGLYLATTMTSGTIANCSFCGNLANTSGGAAYYANLNQCSIVGNQAGRGGGAYGGTLTGCILTTNSAKLAGGGAWSGTLEFCVLGGNRAGDGGGVYNGSLMACTLVNNSAATNGGGANGGGLRNCLLTGNVANTGGGSYSSALYNCTVVGNVATNSGGGISTGTIMNSIVYYNTAPTSSNYSGGSFSACCAMPLPIGTGNITNAPAFVDLAGGNFRLQTNSPCINRGNNIYAVAVDLDGRTRIVGGAVDIGAYEFRGAGMGEFTAWLQQYGLALDGSADFLDSDSDGLNNWQEWCAGTDPTNSTSVLKMLMAR